MTSSDTFGRFGEGSKLVGVGGHATCGLVGLGAAVVLLAATYSALMGVVSLVPLLSTTWLVLAGVLVWLLAWLLADLALVGWRGWRDANRVDERTA
jgi:hypothetical protein